jgi:hypothetical protein
MILAVLAAVAGTPSLAVAATSVTTRSSTVVRVQARRPRQQGKAPPVQYYKEKRGPHCLSAIDISAAAVTGPSQVDFALKGGDRLRAILEDECPALDFYRGFYLSPSADGRICADRDMIRTRSGGECAIDRLRRLVPIDPPPPPKPPVPKHR